MLTPYDEILLHQVPLTFDQAQTSDHRFFDRVWFGGFGSDGARFMCGMGVYKNTNTADGFFVVSQASKQHNLRMSRPLLPKAHLMRLGPLSIEIVEAFKNVKISLHPTTNYDFSAELHFASTSAPHQEKPRIQRAEGRLIQDYVRFDQVGALSGWIDTPSGRVTVCDWFCARDHSWGVRPGVGGFEPMASLTNAHGLPEDIGTVAAGFLLISLMFDSREVSGFIQVHEDGTGRVLYLDGSCYAKLDGTQKPLAVTRIHHRLEFVPGTRTCSSGSIQIDLEDGSHLSIEARTLLPTWCFKGTGYDFGYADERGLGVFRSDLIESDVYDMSHAEDVGLPDGRRIRPWHREGDAELEVNGTPGSAHFAVISRGPILRYGLDGDISNVMPVT